MFESAIQKLVGLQGRKKKATPAKREQQDAPEAPPGVHPDAPAAEAGPGFTLGVTPLGFAEPFDDLAFGSPAARIDEPQVSAADAFDVPLDRAVADREAAKKKKVQRTQSRLPERQQVVAASRAILGRDRTETVEEVKKAMESPDLQTTMGQRVLGEEAARAAKRGDRMALRQALASLVQKVDVSSPKDAAVLLKKEVGLQAGGQVRSLLGQGKATLDSTPGGKLFSKISPMIRDYAPMDMKGEVDGAMGGLAERFALKAQGKVDVVMGTASPAAGAAGAVDLAAAGGAAAEAGGAGAPMSALAGASGGASPGVGAPGSAAPGGGGLSVFEVGSESPAPAGLQAGAGVQSGSAPASPLPGGGGSGAPPSGGGSSLRIGEVDPGQVKFGSSASTGVGEVNPDGKVSVSPGTPAMPFSQTPMGVGEAANQSHGIAMQAGPAPPGSVNVSAVEMSADTARGITPQAGTPPPGSINVGAVEMPAGTPQSAVVQQAGKSVVAGQMTLEQVLQQNPGITEVNLQQVQPSGKGAALKSIGSMARSALLQRFGGGG